MIGILKLSKMNCKIINKKIYKLFIPYQNEKPFMVMTKKKSNMDIYAIVDKDKKIVLKYIDNISENILLTYFWKKYKYYNYNKIINNNNTNNIDKIITIDNNRCKIFDDAIQCIFKNNVYILNIYITDTSKYITNIKQELSNRIRKIKNNNLFPQEIINICSLKKNNNYDTCKVSFKITDIIESVSFKKANVYIDDNLSYSQVKEYHNYTTNIINVYKILTNKNNNFRNIVKYFMNLVNTYAAKEMKNYGIYCEKLKNYNIYTYTYIKNNYTHFTSPLMRYIDNVVRDIIYDNKIVDIDLDKINKQIRFYNKILSSYKIIKNMENDKLILDVIIIYFNLNSIITYSKKLKKNIFIDFRNNVNFKDCFKLINIDDKFKIIVNDIEYILYINQKITIELYLLKKNVNFYTISIIKPFKINLLKDIYI